jgi:hypothetical protein
LVAGFENRLEAERFLVWRKTAKKRMVAKLHAIKAELRRRMHEPVADVGAWLQKVANGSVRGRSEMIVPTAS